MNSLPALCAALVSPVDASGRVLDQHLADHVRWVMNNGCDGVVLFGTTGESASFGLAERQRALGALIADGIDPSRVIVGTGCCSIVDTVQLTRHARSLGCNSVLIHPPFFFNKPSEDGVFAYYEAIIHQLAAKDVQIILYHFPEITGVPVTPSLTRRLLAAFPDQIVGIKDSTGDIMSMAAFAREFPSLKVFSGDDHLLWPLLEAGGYGAITATANLTPNLMPIIASGYRAHSDGAHEAHAIAVGLWEKTLLNFPVAEAVKQVMATYSDDPAWSSVSPPLQLLSHQQRQDLLDQVSHYQTYFPAGLGGGSVKS